MFIITAESDEARIKLPATCEKIIGAIKFKSTILFVNFSLALAESAGGAPPALLTRISNLPYSLWQSSTTSFMSSLLRTSQLTKCAFLSGTPISVSGRVRAHTSTSAPSSRNVSVIAFPIPLVPPVTIATLSFKLFSILFTIRP